MPVVLLCMATEYSKRNVNPKFERQIEMMDPSRKRKQLTRGRMGDEEAILKAETSALVLKTFLL